MTNSETQKFPDQKKKPKMPNSEIHNPKAPNPLKQAKQFTNPHPQNTQIPETIKAIHKLGKPKQPTEKQTSINPP